jgi:hypothetical protein
LTGGRPALLEHPGDPHVLTQPATGAARRRVRSRGRRPEKPRDVISFALARRSALETMRRGGAFNSDYCDADPGLLRAAKHHGEPSGRDCPVCRRSDLVEVTWVYGAQLGPLSGSARATGQLAGMAHEYGRFRVYVVEVCRACAWNHLVLSFTLGDGQARPMGRRAASP